MFLYCLFMKGTMTGLSDHRANDDCAVCRAWSKRQAMRKFARLYRNFGEADVFRAKFRRGVAVLTDF